MVEFEEPVMWASIALAPVLAGALAVARPKTGTRGTASAKPGDDPPARYPVDEQDEDGPLLTLLAIFGSATRAELIDHAFSGPALVDMWLASAERRGLIDRFGSHRWVLSDSGRCRLDDLS